MSVKNDAVLCSKLRAREVVQEINN